MRPSETRVVTPCTLLVGDAGRLAAPPAGPMPDFRAVLADAVDEARRLVAERRPALVVMEQAGSAAALGAAIASLRAASRTRYLPVVLVTRGPPGDGDLPGGDASRRPDASVAGSDDALAIVPPLLAVLRRTRPTSIRGAWKCGDLVLDEESFRLLSGDLRVPLLPIGFRLLATLVDHGGRTVSRHSLRSLLWGSSSRVDLRAVDRHVVGVRRALGDLGVPAAILLAHGVGYRFEAGRRP